MVVVMADKGGLKMQLKPVAQDKHLEAAAEEAEMVLWVGLTGVEEQEAKLEFIHGR